MAIIEIKQQEQSHGNGVSLRRGVMITEPEFAAFIKPLELPPVAEALIRSVRTSEPTRRVGGGLVDRKQTPLERSQTLENYRAD